LSNIDPTKPTAGQATTQSVRDNFQAAADEIDANAAAVAANDISIANNTANISTNAASISQNVSDIATNTADIAANTVDIAANAADISALQAGGAAYVAYAEISVTAVPSKDNGIIGVGSISGFSRVMPFVNPQPDTNFNVQVSTVNELQGVTCTVTDITTTGFRVNMYDAAGAGVSVITSVLLTRTDQPFV